MVEQKYTVQRIHCDVRGCKEPPSWSLRWVVGAMKYTLLCDAHHLAWKLDGKLTDKA